MASKEATYTLAVRAGYKTTLTNMGNNVYDDEAYYNKGNFPDLEVTRPGVDTDLSLLNSHCLMTVNGYIHPTVFQNERLYIPNGSKSLLISKENQVGILSFNSLDKPLKKLTIDASMITPESSIPLYDKLTITFERDIGNCFLVLAGYMIFEQPEIFYRVSGNSFVLRLDRINYIEKLYELKRQRKIFQELGMEEPTVNPDLLDSTIVRSDITILMLMNLFNTFLVEVPCETLTTTPIYLEHSNVPGNFRTEVEPIYPIMVGYGKLTEYIKRRSNDVKYTVYTSDCHYDNYLLSKLPEGSTGLINSNRVVGTTHRLTQAFFLRVNMEE